MCRWLVDMEWNLIDGEDWVTKGRGMNPTQAQKATVEVAHLPVEG
jgi:hypothetical protein